MNGTMMSSETDDVVSTHGLYDGCQNGSVETPASEHNGTSATERRPSSSPILDILTDLQNSLLIMNEDRHSIIRNLQEIPIREDPDEDYHQHHGSAGYVGPHYHPTTGNAEIKATTIDSDGEEDESNSESEKVIFGLKNVNSDQQQNSTQAASGPRNQAAGNSNKNLIFNPFSPPATDGDEIQGSGSGFMRGLRRSESENSKPLSNLLVMMRPANHSNNKSLDGNRTGNHHESSSSALTPPSTASLMMDHLKSQVFSSFMIQKQKISEKLFTPIPSSCHPKHGSAQAAPGQVLSHSQSSPPFGFGFVLKSSDPMLESRINSLKTSRCKHRQLQRIIQKQVMTSLEVLSQSFSSISLLMNELSSATLDFSNINTSNNEFNNTTSCESKKSKAADGIKANGAEGEESEIQISEDDSDSEDCARIASSSGNLIQSNSDLMNSYRELAVKLKFLSNEANKAMVGMQFFESNLSTLIDKSMKDSFDTINCMEENRIKFDAERSNLYLRQQQQAAAGQVGPGLQPSGGSLNPALLTEGETAKLNSLELKYVKLKEDVSVKLNFLSFNQQKVMKKEVSLFNSLIFGLFKDPSASFGAVTGCSHHHHHLDSSHHHHQVTHTNNMSILDSVLKAYSIHPHLNSSTSSGRLSSSTAPPASNK